jgi:hypothetical protein
MPGLRRPLDKRKTITRAEIQRRRDQWASARAAQRWQALCEPLTPCHDEIWERLDRTFRRINQGIF